MADISKEKLKELIDEILKNADLTTTTAKAVRQQLQKQLNCDLLPRKKEIDNLVMDFVNNSQDEENGGEEASAGSEDEDDASASEEEEKPKKAAKRSSASSKSKPAKKKKKAGSDDDDDDDDDGSDEDYVSKERSAKKTKKTRAPGKGKGRGTGFTRPCSLSPDLAAIVGSDSLPRHEVVKKVWSIIKERNLYDPKNKQFAVCDPELMKVIGVKRFRIFGMLKYLKPHFVG